MVWVRSEYAEELAVVFAWFAALTPWSVTFSSFDGFGSMLFVRFPLFQVQYLYGIPTVNGRTLRQSGVALTDRIYVADPLSSQAFYAGTEMGTASVVWGVGALAFAAALVLSVALYLREERVAQAPFDPVRAMGALLGASALALAAATVLFWRAFTGVPIPLGVVLLFVFAGVLLTVDRT